MKRIGTGSEMKDKVCGIRSFTPVSKTGSRSGTLGPASDPGSRLRALAWLTRPHCLPSQMILFNVDPRNLPSNLRQSNEGPTRLSVFSGSQLQTQRLAKSY